VYEAVKVPGRLLNGLTHLIVALEIEDISDEIQCVLIVLNFGVETCQVEPVGKVVLVDFAEVLVAP
jgi:hypothetical protein